MTNEFSRHFRLRAFARRGKRNSGEGSQSPGTKRPDGRRRTLLPAHLLVLR